MVFHADLPEDLTLVATGHQELQRVLMGPLKAHREGQTLYTGPFSGGCEELRLVYIRT